MSTCRGCGKSITWARSNRSGRNIPVDFDLGAIPDGAKVAGHLYKVIRSENPELPNEAEPVLNSQALFEHVRAGTLPAERLAGVGVSHFLTCPKADTFSKSKAGKS